MARLLYKLGLSAAKHPLAVLLTWILALIIAAGSYLAFGGTLSSTVSIPGTETDKVTNRLADEFPDAAKGTGEVVIKTTDGSEFTDQQREDIVDVLDEVADIDGVDETMDPFELDKTMQDSAAQIEDGQTKLDDSQQQIEDGQKQIDDGRKQLDSSEKELKAGQDQLDAAKEQAQAAGMPEAAIEQQFAAQQQQLDAAKEQLDEGKEELENRQKELDDGREQAEDSAEQLTAGKTLLDASEGYSTVSDNDSTAVATVMFTVADLDVQPETKDAVTDTFENAGVEGVEFFPSQQISQAIPSIMGPAEVVGLVIAAIVLVIMLGTFVTAGLPILNALIGVGVSVAAAMAFSSIVDMNSTTPVLGVMLGLAVGIDYALFIVNRHRQQLKRGMEVHHSIGLANGTSGTAVIFAGTTVIIALLALNITGIPFMGIMGNVGAVSVLSAVLVAVTLTPAMLSWIGERALSKRERAALRANERNGNNAEDDVQTRAIKPMSTARAVITAIVAVAALVVVALPALSLRLALPDATSEAEDSAAFQAYETIEQEFGEGRNGPLVVTVDLPEDLSETEVMQAEADVAEQLTDIDNVASVVPGGENEDSTVAMFQVIPEEGPTAESTENVVNDLRNLDPAGEASNVAVAGMTSGAIDVSETLAESLPLYLGVVVGLSLIIMILVFRSILVPLIATGGFVLSLFAALGAVVAIYQWGWLGPLFQVHSPNPILAFLPVIMIGILFGLAMDYQLFISTGMREAYVHGDRPRVAVMRGFKAGRSVVIAAAIIMISVFGGFIYADSAMIRPMGFALAFGVLVDAFIVRLLLIPSLMHMLGGAAWWIPRWLDKIMPNVDVEGSGLVEAEEGNDANTSDDAEQPVEVLAAAGSESTGNHASGAHAADSHVIDADAEDETEVEADSESLRGDIFGEDNEADKK